MRRKMIADRMGSRDRSPGFGPGPQGPRTGPPELEALRRQVEVLARQVQELRSIVDRQREGMKHFGERRETSSRPPHPPGGPGPEARDSRPPLPPKGDFGRGDRPKGRDGGPGDRPKPRDDDRPSPRGDRDPQGNPPPPR